MAYIGNQPTDNFVTFATQNFSTSATSSYTLDHAVSNENEIALFINNVRQHPGSGKAYTATGTALTLSENTASTDVMYCIFLGRAIQSTVPSTNSITAAMVGNDLISGKDALTSSPADTDELLISDAGTLKRIDVSLVGGNNSPSFRAEVASAQSISDATATVIGFGTETFDNGSCYDGTNKFTVPSGEAGKYVVYSQCNLNPSDLNYASNLSLYLYKNGSRWTIAKTDFRNNTGSSSTIIVQDTMDLSVGDYIQIYAYIDTTSGTPSITGQSNLKSVFSAYKIIE
jgi:hypothetical protein